MIDHKARERLASRIDALPRVRLAYLPTPLEDAPRLSGALGGPRILIKRDDLTGLPLSGNKTRMFEFSLAQALREGADTVVMSSSVQSNYCRQLAFACRKLGLELHLVLRRVRGERDLDIQGNLFLDLLAGAKVEIVDAEDADQPQLVRAKAQVLRQEGHKVYEARGTEHGEALEALAYVDCALELAEQLEEKQINANYLFVSANDTTQAGLCVGAKYLGAGWQIIGINPSRDNSTSTIARIANEVAALLRLEISFTSEEIVNTNAYVGEGYGKMTREAFEATELVARTEAILLDPVYTGKAMAALVCLVQEGKIRRDETVVFVHTGGFPTLFAYRDELMQFLTNRPVIRTRGN